MCGIIAITRKKSIRVTPGRESLEQLAALDELIAPQTPADIGPLIEKFTILKEELSGVAGIKCLLRDLSFGDYLQQICANLETELQQFELAIISEKFGSGALEEINKSLIELKDLLWHISQDRVGVALAIEELFGTYSDESSVELFLSIQEVLTGIDRLEVRGRDSAGLHLMIQNHGLDLSDPVTQSAIALRSQDMNYGSGAIREFEGTLSFVYKVASEIGELGDNSKALRELISTDDLLHAALRTESATGIVIGHSRWASVGIISEPNAHPMNSEILNQDQGPYIVAVANGDVDNFADLKKSENLQIPRLITSDSKVIPAIMSKELSDLGEQRENIIEAFRETVNTLNGSVAIAANSAVAPDKLLLALRGSGQGLYVGLAEDAFIVASEPYGLVETTNKYLRVNGESINYRKELVSGPGEILTLSLEKAGTLEGIKRIAYDGTPLPIEGTEVETTDITTRDIDRRNFPHFLLKEIFEAPESFEKTLRGKLIENENGLEVLLSEEELPNSLVKKLERSKIRKIYVIGQGTAAVAGQALARYLNEETTIPTEDLPATELSGFRLKNDMSDVLVIAISQSGTTTDTNRTVDLARTRGASVVSIVNRRNSDLAQKSEGVIYTSDGRDIEMSVASTKAFYSQVAAGFLLGIVISDAANRGSQDPTQIQNRNNLLIALKELPSKMKEVLLEQSSIREVASELAPSRRHWAIVGNGSNIIAAREIRIKLSELCYKSIAADFTEDKKHIDLSSEPMILICATGLHDSTEADVAKEVAIYKAHKGAPIVISDNIDAYPSAHRVISVPYTDHKLAFVLSAMAGHLFGYEAALSINALANPFRETRSSIEKQLSLNPRISAQELLDTLKPKLEEVSKRFFDGLRAGEYNGSLEASTATRIATLYRYALGNTPLDSYQIDSGKVGTPATILEDLNAALTIGIEELIRPIDAIKHQAKTVTVGISRSDEELIQLSLVAEVIGSGMPRDRISYRNLRNLAALDVAVENTLGFIRYAIEGNPEKGNAQLHVIDKGGIARDLTSRTQRHPKLKGSKHLVALQQNVMITKGRHDGRIIILVPEVKDKQSVGLTLMHIQLRDRLSEQAARHVLQGYQGRYTQIFDYVTETEPTFRSDILASIPVEDLLIMPVEELAELWRA
tara:strand:- start:408 stop:3839 length:3432 start_codon:yes stop_codon:yes gene_type:complete